MANDVTEKAFSDLDTAGQLDNTDIFAISKVSGSSWISAKATLTALATKIATAFNFTSDLQTTAKTLTGAINEIAQGGGGGGTDVIADDFSTESTYAVGDYVMHEGSLYKCTTAVTTAGAWDSTKWTETIVMDEVEAGGGGGGTTVIANPSGEATDDLIKVQIGSTIYDIPGGGSSSGLLSGKVYTLKTKTWTGTGTNPLVLTVDEKPDYVLSIWGPGLSNTKCLSVGFHWGATSMFASYNENGAGTLYDTMSYSNNDMTISITGTDEGAAFNASGGSYTMYYLKEESLNEFVEVSGTLTAGQTQITLNSAALTSDSNIEPFTSVFGVNPTNVEIVSPTPSLINDILVDADNTKVTSSSADSVSVAPWKAFDGTKGSSAYASPYYSWLAGNADAPCWLQYHFESAKYIDSVKVYVYCNNGTYTGSAKIQGSNDGTNWTDISSSESITAPAGTETELDFACSGGSYEYVRLYSQNAFTVYGGASIFVGEMEIYGREGSSAVRLTFPEQQTDLGVKVRIS